MPLRRRDWLALGGLLLASFLLFAPRYARYAGYADFTPFFPDEHPHGAYAWNFRSVWEYIKALGLRRANMDMFRMSVEWFTCVAVVMATARSRLSPWIRRGVVAGYGLLLTFLTYHYAIGYFFNRTPILFDDARLAINLMHFMSDLSSVKWLGIVAALVIAFVGVLWLVNRSLRGAQELAMGPVALPLWAAVGAVVLYGGACILWFGIDRDDPLMQLPTKQIVTNLRHSARRSSDVRAAQTASADRTYDAFLEAKLTDRPNVYLLLIEAYGAVLESDADLKPAHRAFMGDLATRLDASGFAQRTTHSVAPVYGGGSWMSIATIQSGVAVKNQLAYDQFTRVAGRYPHLTRFFDVQGYTTIATQPGNAPRAGLRAVDPFDRDVMIEGPDLDYTGRRFGWGKIPDQYSLGHAADVVLADAQAPHFFFYIGVTTHAPWEDRPPMLEDWRGLNDRDVRPVGGGYADTIQYEWHAVAEFIEQTANDEAVYIVIGDHQPALRNREHAPSYDAPIHVISRNHAWVEGFARHGFRSGMSVPAGQPTLRHEGVYSLIVSSLLPDEVEVRPEGVARSALNR